MWRIRIRWKMLFEPWCWIVDHDLITVYPGTALDTGGQMCNRCCKEWYMRIEGFDVEVHGNERVHSPHRVYPQPPPGLRTRALGLLDRVLGAVKTS
jgi:hypothetical protein